ncbi:MAG: toll/interleukin-1 receptor domain-containing protein [Thermaceae bacterium]|nr:toll/interleukin-1 receptor domain-containing protein [Thermaceae bacterium]
MKVFLSYSLKEDPLVNEIANAISPHAEVFYWEQSQTPGEPVWDSIYRWIDNSDLVLAIITDNTVSRAMSVGQEIGHAKARGKLIIPLVTSEVKISDLGFLSEITYQRIDPINPEPALAKVVHRIQEHKQQMLIKNLSITVGIVILVFGLIVVATQDTE